jgi:hypothetical protein
MPILPKVCQIYNFNWFWGFLSVPNLIFY